MAPTSLRRQGRVHPGQRATSLNRKNTNEVVNEATTATTTVAFVFKAEYTTEIAVTVKHVEK